MCVVFVDTRASLAEVRHFYRVDDGIRKIVNSLDVRRVTEKKCLDDSGKIPGSESGRMADIPNRPRWMLKLRAMLAFSRVLLPFGSVELLFLIINSCERPVTIVCDYK